MTAHKKLKTRIRARMARTGERYAAARAALLGELHRAAPPRARHDQTFALARALARRGVVLPATGAAPTEAWLLGLGGGIGFQYFTFSYEGHLPHLYVGTRCAHQYAYDAGFVSRALTGLGMQAEVHETGSRKKAAATLDTLLADGPVLAWVGLEALRGRTAGMGATPWVVLVHDVDDGPDGRTFGIEDAQVGAIEVSAERLAEARAAVKKQKHRLVVPAGTPSEDPAAGVAAGLAYCVAELAGEHAVGGYARNFGLGALEKWAGLVESKTKKGWRATFPAGPARVAGLAQAYAWLEVATGGGAFRPMYADFLAEAATRTGNTELTALADRVRASGAAWTALAEGLLDPSVPGLAVVREAVRATGAPLDASTLPGLDADVPDAVLERLAEGLRARLADERDIAAVLGAPR